MKKWVCVVGFYLMAVYPENPKRTLNELIKDGIELDKSITINSTISIQEYKSYFRILIDSKYNIEAFKRHCVDIGE